MSALTEDETSKQAITEVTPVSLCHLPIASPMPRRHAQLVAPRPAVAPASDKFLTSKAIYDHLEALNNAEEEFRSIVGRKSAPINAQLASPFKVAPAPRRNVVATPWFDRPSNPHSKSLDQSQSDSVYIPSTNSMDCSSLSLASSTLSNSTKTDDIDI